jgi:hypothetical protein
MSDRFDRIERRLRILTWMVGMQQLLLLKGELSAEPGSCNAYCCPSAG